MCKREKTHRRDIFLTTDIQESAEYLFAYISYRRFEDMHSCNTDPLLRYIAEPMKIRSIEIGEQQIRIVYGIGTLPEIDRHAVIDVSQDNFIFGNIILKTIQDIIDGFRMIHNIRRDEPFWIILYRRWLFLHRDR